LIWSNLSGRYSVMDRPRTQKVQKHCIGRKKHTH